MRRLRSGVVSSQAGGPPRGLDRRARRKGEVSESELSRARRLAPRFFRCFAATCLHDSRAPRSTLSRRCADPVRPCRLRALWFDAKGDWNAAHKCVDDKADPDSMWVHAYLHRKEGDLSQRRLLVSPRAAENRIRAALEENGARSPKRCCRKRRHDGAVRARIAAQQFRLFGLSAGSGGDRRGRAHRARRHRHHADGLRQIAPLSAAGRRSGGRTRSRLFAADRADARPASNPRRLWGRGRRAPLHAGGRRSRRRDRRRRVGPGKAALRRPRASRSGRNAEFIAQHSHQALRGR